MIDEARFWENVAMAPSGCWEWQGFQNSGGYGRVSVEHNKKVLVHRLAYELLVGSIPEALQIDHLCRNKLCVRPDHLEAVTQLENMRRRYATQTRCLHGHGFTPENTHFSTGRYRRVCLTCRRTRDRLRLPQRKTRVEDSGAFRVPSDGATPRLSSGAALDAPVSSPRSGNEDTGHSLANGV